MTDVLVIVPLCVVVIVIGIAFGKSDETGQMVLIEHLKEDWTYRLPFRLRNNRYRGMSRSSYQFLAILYYTLKAVIIITLCAYYYIFAGLFAAMKWVWRKIECADSSEAKCVEQEDSLGSVANNIKTDRRKYSAPAEKRPSNHTRRAAEDRFAESDENAISYLWNHASENEWHEALEHYYELLKTEEKALDLYMENVDANEIARLSAVEFYDFLYDKYYVWKYTAKNRLATTRKSLKRYVDENRLSELADIKRRLFRADRSNIESCLRIAAEIRGLGPAGASGLLSILFPENFGTIDQYVVRALREVEGVPHNAELAKMNPDSLSINDGILLIRILREQAARLNEKFDTDFWNPRKIDMVFWAAGRVRR